MLLLALVVAQEANVNILVKKLMKEIMSNNVQMAHACTRDSCTTSSSSAASIMHDARHFLREQPHAAADVVVVESLEVVNSI